MKTGVKDVLDGDGEESYLSHKEDKTVIVCVLSMIMIYFVKLRCSMAVL